MSKEAEKLADAYAEASFDQGLHRRMQDPAPEVAREKLVALLRRQAERIRELRDSMESYLVAWSNEERKPGWCGRVRAARARVDAALSNTKEET